jgi:hypothetical protein
LCRLTVERPDDSHAHLWVVLETVPVVSASTDLVIMADDPGVS